MILDKYNYKTQERAKIRITDPQKRDTGYSVNVKDDQLILKKKIPLDSKPK